MEEDLVIERDGRVIGVAVRVRGGFMFFSCDPFFKALEGTVYQQAEIISQRVTASLQAKRRCKGCSMRTSLRPAAGDAACANVVHLHPSQRSTLEGPEPPDAA